ncbi:amino acid adenylation domain-containing protein [Deinococcus sp. KSM4-11]|uniref:non-ribosomal peptide synthetase n=1 Tax=Deinococcus sp. KSM4-11 TaxID=2568654 RepID=UPI0010A35E2C|nr:amino acid adenylation domain-containing protein [Deinococcus sp. KSM4-11]THF85586.1 amino acid adenylation domain-containing protein [Deinococcus sp. KSM4-11]
MTTPTDTSKARTEGLSPEQKRALLRQLLKERAGPSVSAPARAASSLPGVTPDPDGAHAPFALTDVQHAYWLGRSDGLELGGVGAHIYSELDLPLLDHGRMQRAWQAVIDRHPMLRTVVQPDGLQRVLDSVPPYAIAHADLSGLDEPGRQATLLGIREAMRARRYDPQVWPMFDLRTFTLSSGSPLTRVCLSFDMLILDLRSFQLVLEEWFALYQDEHAALPDLPITFRDYRLGEAALAGTPLAEASRAYWTARIADLPPAPELPRRRGPDVPTPESAQGRTFTRRAARLSPTDWQALKSAASARGLTPAAVLLSAFGQVLSAWSGERRFTLTLTIFNRLPLHPAVPRLVGDFTGITLLEFDLTPSEPFAARAARVQTQLFADLEHRHYSGVQVLRDLAREHGAHSALHPVVFTSHLAGAGRDGDTFTPAMPAEIVYGLSQTPQVTLDYQVFEQAGGLNVQWDVREALFPNGVLDGMFDANMALLRRLLAGTQPWTATQEALAPATHLARRRAVEAPCGHDPLTSPLTLPRLFENRARTHPDSPALLMAGQELTYGDLDRHSAAYAALLQREGAARDGRGRPRPVAVVCERGFAGVVGVLAVLRAGGAYLPIDPDLPTARLQTLLRDSGANHVLTQPHLAATLAWPPGLVVTAIGDSLPPGTLQPVEIDPGDLAYIIYTSGSTGTPKGVMVDHRGAVNTVLDVNDRFGVNAGDRVLGLSALTFDLSVYDLFGSFAAGAALVLPDHAGRRDPQHWLSLLTTLGVTIWNSVPALLEMLLEVAPLAEVQRLRLILLSGDWIPLGLPPRVRSGLPNARLISMGGATEASIWSVLYEVTAIDPHWNSVPYGRAMRHQTMQVLTDGLNAAPDHAPGEIFIGGVGLARGYWRDAERSAERFFCHPRTGERLYRTGDLGRTLPDGTIELLGRVDRQVKVRGHRIELGEIEHAIRGVPGVRDTLVTLRRRAAGKPALAAYLIPDQPIPSPPTPDVTAEHALLAELAGAADALRPYRSGNAALDDDVALLTSVEARQHFKRDRPTPRFPAGAASYALPTPSGPHLERLHQRRSYRRFALSPIPAAEFLTWLGILLPDPQSGRYAYASAGDLYPVRATVWIRPGRVHDLPGGLYVLDTPARRLSALPDAAPVPREAYHALINRPMFDEAAFALYLTVDVRDMAPVYGDLTRHFATLEAGLMTGLLELGAAGTDLGVCQVGQVDEDAVRRALGLGPAQLLLHSLVGGRLEADRTNATASAGIADLRPERRVERLLERVATLSDEEATALRTLGGEG